MGLIFRKSFRLGPFKFNFTKNGFSSWSFKTVSYTHLTLPTILRV